MTRRHSKTIRIASLPLGGTSPIVIQSMTNTDPEDFEATLRQVRALKDAGCDLVRLTVPSENAANVLGRVREAVDLPLVADIHFDYKMALLAMDRGADKIRINPGNLGGREKLEAVAQKALDTNTPIRVGINGGSLEKELLKKYGHPCPEALCESALNAAKSLEDCGVSDLVLSVKSSDVKMAVAANRLIAASCDYPLHLGVTEAGTKHMGTIKSAVGIGSLLLDGIGDTIRVSLTADPVEEIAAAREILDACGLSQGGVEIVSCPTCGRTKIDLVGIATELETRIKQEALAPSRRLKVAVMGCAVNGPGEAKEADFGIAGGVGEALLFEKGEITKKIPQDRVVDCLLDKIRTFC